MSSVRIGAHDIQVVEAPAGDLRSDQTLARADFIANRITLPMEAPASRKLELLYHEMAHFMLMGHSAAYSSNGTLPEETVAVVMGEGILSLIRENPQLIQDTLNVFKAKTVKRRTKKKVKRSKK